MSALTAALNTDSIDWNKVEVFETIDITTLRTVTHKDFLGMMMTSARTQGRAEVRIASEVEVSVSCNHADGITAAIVGVGPFAAPSDQQPNEPHHILSLGGVHVLTSPFFSKTGTLTFLPGVGKTLKPTPIYGDLPRLWFYADCRPSTSNALSGTTHVYISLRFTLEVKGYGWIAPFSRTI
uniref:Uncharacterized protein n=1 Tax=Rhizoctonia solani positive-strand RNA virus 1 TaxID=1807789 RepID=A0A127AXC5_9VIRU|nr:hypothetical protein [Rhizoctonia solani positive-strand RNA virus 1]